MSADFHDGSRAAIVTDSGQRVGGRHGHGSSVFSNSAEGRHVQSHGLVVVKIGGWCG